MKKALKKIVIKKVGEDAFESVLEDDSLSQMQKLVGGYIEFLHFSFSQPYANIILVCNEEGKLEGLKTNIFLRNKDGLITDEIVGDIFFIGDADENGENKSLTSEQIKFLLMWLN